MLTIKDRNDATATVWTEKEISDALEAVARTSEGWRRDPTPLEVLRRAVQGSFELARRLPSSRVRLFGEAGFGRAEGQPQGPSVFDLLSRHVRAAQRAGELKAGDASLLTALIVGSVLGAADLAQHTGAKRGRCAIEEDIPALLLLDLLATKGCN
jgi:hypothetical protein